MGPRDRARSIGAKKLYSGLYNEYNLVYNNPMNDTIKTTSPARILCPRHHRTTCNCQHLLIAQSSHPVR